MAFFTVDIRSKKSRARIGYLKTKHGIVETPAFVPVATTASVKGLTSEDIVSSRSQILIANTYHLHVTCGEDIVARSGGIQKFMSFNGPMMTDSGGFQVFSLGFGQDFNVGKVLKFFPGKDTEYIHSHSMPQNIKITDDGVFFKSPINGSPLFIGPKESIKIQEKIGADIIFAFDECTAPLSKREYILEALDRTHRWAKICVETKKSDQFLFGIIQGSRFEDLRQGSARYIQSLDFPGYGIGGDLGSTKDMMIQIIQWVTPHLEDNKPRHLLGIGHIEDMQMIIKEGIDLFDCTAPTHYARRGTLFTSGGRINLRKKMFLKDKKPIDKKCDCFVCQKYSRSYLSHLLRAKEITALSLLSYHNVYFFNSYVAFLRKRIKEGKL